MSFSCFYDTIYTREIIGFSTIKNTTNTTELQDRYSEPRDVYDVISEVIRNIASDYQSPRRDPAQEVLTTAKGGLTNDRESKRSPQGV